MNGLKTTLDDGRVSQSIKHFEFVLDSLGELEACCIPRLARQFHETKVALLSHSATPSP